MGTSLEIKGSYMRILTSLAMKASILGLVLAATLSGCGVLEIQVKPVTSKPSSTPLVLEPSRTAQPLEPTYTITPRAVVTETPSPMPTQKSDLAPGTPLQILQIHMLDISHGWAIGQAEGTAVQRVLYSSDGGRTWQDRTPLAAIAHASVDGLTAAAYFSSPPAVWAVFSAPKQPAGSDPLVVWRSNDNGVSWKASQPLDFSGVNMEFQVPSDLGFYDAQSGWLLVHLGVGMSHDYIAVFTTADGGATWQRRLDPDSPYALMSCSKSGLVFTSATSAWLAGNCPGLMPQLFLYSSADGGKSWTAELLPVPEGKPADYFSLSNIGCGISAIQTIAQSSLALTLNCSNYENQTYRSVLYLSQDGQSWVQHVLPAAFNQLSFIDPVQAILLGANRLDESSGGMLFTSVNSGASWTQSAAVGWTGTPDFVDLQNGWVLAAHNGVSAFVHTLNGGKTWEEIKPVSGS